MDGRLKGHVVVAVLAAALVIATGGWGTGLFESASSDNAGRGNGSQQPGTKPGSKGLKGKVVTIDPGHNGENGANPDAINRQVDIGQGQTKECDTTGTQTASGFTESRYTMDVARRLAKVFRHHGAKVFLTRRNDHGVGPCINRRAKIGDKHHSDAAISIHADGGPVSGRGFHVIYPSRIRGLTEDIYRPSKRLARGLRSAYERRTGLPRADYIGHNGLDRRDDLGGLRLSNVPKVFIETGNMQNPTDARHLEKARFRKRVAMGIYRGIATFLERR